MTIVVDRDLKIRWADQSAMDYFGPDILNQNCHTALYGRAEPCAVCIARRCFEDGQEHVWQATEIISPRGRLICRHTVRPAEFNEDGTVYMVKEILEDVTAVQLYERVVPEIENEIRDKRGKARFAVIATYLQRLLKADQIYIGEFIQNATRVRMVACCRDGKFCQLVDHPVTGTPCERLLDQTHWSTGRDIAGIYPDYIAYQGDTMNAYTGVRLTTMRGKPLGVLAAAWRHPREDLSLAESLLALFGRHVAPELEYHLQINTLENFKHIVSTSRDLLALIDTNYTHLAVNNAYASFWGRSAEAVVGRSVSDVTDTVFFKEVVLPAAEKCLSGQESAVEMWLTSSAGDSRCLDILCSPHFEKGTHRVNGLVLSCRDISRRKNLEANLRQTFKMETIGHLAGGIAHDFNNILGAMIGYAELALGSVKEQPDVAGCLKEVLRAGARASELVKQILAFSRKSNHLVEPVQPKAIIRESLRLLRATIPVMIRIEAVIESDAYVLADPTQLHQIIINLCANANHAMRDTGGLLTVRLTDVELASDQTAESGQLEPGPYVQLSISDTGHGIPVEIREKIFDPFFTTKDRGEGTGMGLAMVQGIVKSYNGAISLFSEMDRGTTFTILLPVAVVDEAAVPLSQAAPPRGSEHILIVDDEESLVEIACAMLGGLGYTTRGIIDSRQALDVFNTDPAAFDLVLSDMAMPGLSGEKLARQMLALRHDLPIILMTGFSDKLTAEDAQQIGIRKLLLKPLSTSVLAAAVREVLDGKPAQA